MSSFTSTFSSDLFGSGGKSSEKQTAEDTRYRSFAAADVSAEAGGEVNTCPQFIVWPKDRILTVYESGRDGDNTGVIYQGEISKTARECQIGQGSVSVKYGVSGRVLLGPRGRSGAVNMPMLVQLMDVDKKQLQSKRVMANVSISQNDPIGYFTVVQDISFQLPVGARPADYKLYVAFEKKQTEAKPQF